MQSRLQLQLSLHDDVSPEEGRLIDEGLGASNAAAARLHEFRPIAVWHGSWRSRGSYLGDVLQTRQAQMIPVVHPLSVGKRARGAEVVTALASGWRFKLEHIASRGDVSPPGFWYDQDDSEWVALVFGHATLEFEDGMLSLEAGDSILIPAHMKHRVVATSFDAVWIALHFRAETDVNEA